MMLKQPAVRIVIAISLGAIVGALSRYYLGLGIHQVWDTALPYGTFVVNITGCFGMGLLATLLLGRSIGFYPDLHLLILTGFFGSYTTFSSYELESARLFLQSDWVAGLVYWMGSAWVGFFSLQFGMMLAKWILQKFDVSDETLRDRDGAN